METVPIPLVISVGVKTLLESGNGVLFVGAGIGWSVANANGQPMPDGEGLALGLADEFNIKVDENPTLAKVAQVVDIRHGRPKLVSALTKRLADYEPNEQLQWLFKLRWKSIFTTNYDYAIQRCYELNATPHQIPVTISAARGLSNFDPRFDVPIYHLHGCLFDGSDSPIFITEQDYANFAERRRMLFEVLKRECATSRVIYLGYSNQDPNWAMILSEMRREFGPATPPAAYRVARSTDILDREILKSQGIETIDATIDAFVAHASTVVDSSLASVTSLDAVSGSVPAAMTTAFDNNPAATLRMLNAWEYISHTSFEVPPNTSSFLQGNHPNWGVLANGHYFTRDVEVPVSEAIIDFATAPKPRPQQIVLLGPAGYGITTALMSIGVGLVRDKIAPVFRLRPGATISPGDVEYACSICDRPPVFIVDNASDHAAAFRSASAYLRARHLLHLFLMGDRLNEWRTSPHRIKADEFIVDPLSDGEIDRLLLFLENEGALNKLASLEPALRIAAIRQKHDRQLLVAMKEATEGAPFSAIIEDEFRSLSSDFAKKVYAVIACAYATRQFIRDALLADILETSLVDMHHNIGSSLDGVVEFDCVDVGRGLYAARCRHHIIAEIVWERCVLPGEREQVLQSLVRHLNLTHYQDSKLFETLIRDDRQIDGLESLDGRIGFFEWACKKDPDSPYVRQHYARMLQRSGRLELALAAIDASILQSPRTRVLYHTKGVILRDMAMYTTAPEAARRRLAQAEEAFRNALDRDNRDTYSYQSLAELYLGWAKRCDDPVEEAAYLAKCEETLRKGLICARRREELWIVSAKVQKWLGNQPKSIDRLKKAGSSPIARYLLGRAYFDTGSLTEAKAIFEELIAADPNQYRVALCYGHCLLALGEPTSRAIAPLRLAELYAFRDPEFVGTLGGLLFLNSDYAESADVFRKGTSGSIAVEDRRRITFKPNNPDSRNEPLRLKGRVGAVKPGHIWINVTGLPPIYSSATHINCRPAVRGTLVTFQLAFNADGALGIAVAETPASSS